MTEETLMAAYCRGDMEAFDRLFAMIGPHVYGFFLRAFRSEGVADDLLQTTFLKLHQFRDQYRQGEPLRPWLFAIAARVRVDEYRKSQRMNPGRPAESFDGQGAALPPEAETEGEAPIFRPEDGERVHLVRQAVDSLPESQRMIVHLHRYEGLTFTEIGQALGLSAGAVKLRAFRAYARLRKQLRPLMDVEAGS